MRTSAAAPNQVNTRRFIPKRFAFVLLTRCVYSSCERARKPLFYTVRNKYVRSRGHSARRVASHRAARARLSPSLGNILLLRIRASQDSPDGAESPAGETFVIIARRL